MLRKFLLPLLACVGAFIALLVVFWCQKKTPVPFIPFPPPQSPYVHAIAGEGIVESASENISIGSPFSEIITKIYVVEGDDIRLYQAQAETARNQIRAAIVNWENLKTQFAFYEQLTDKRAVSKQQYEQAYYAMREAEEQVRVAQAQLGEIEANIERSLIHAPIDGEILQVNIHVGEVAPNVPTASAQLMIPYASSQYPLILMGSLEPLHLRIDIDEEDAWRYRKGAPATAFVRGNSNIHYPLQFVRIEPYIVPKASFTGDTTERIDTRVLQMLYRFHKRGLPIYAGQLLDVYFEAPPLPVSEVEQKP
jgi:HlyD family secretion protein